MRAPNLAVIIAFIIILCQPLAAEDVSSNTDLNQTSPTNSAPQDRLNQLLTEAQNGNVEAMYNYACTLINTKGDEDAAIQWMKKAADLGHLQALEFCGTLLYAADDPDQSQGAINYLSRAAEQGSILAHGILGNIYYDGTAGAEVDYIKSFKHFKVCANAGAPLSQGMLAHLYLNGLGTPKNSSLARKWAQEAAKQDNWQGQYILAVLYQFGEGDLPQDPVLAYAWYNLASTKEGKADVEDDAPARKYRDELGYDMTPAQVKEAQQLSSSWKPGQLLMRTKPYPRVSIRKKK